jgi:hypothetical protein
MSEHELTPERSVMIGARSGQVPAEAQASGSLLGGGPRGNELLTTANGALLIVLLAALGVTILFVGQFVVEHLFLGLALLGPLALKLASTGYRFVRYYRGDPDYVSEGPPPILLRLLAPGVVLSTLIVFASGVVLLFTGPADREPWLLLHKASFIVWLGLMGAHVLGHLPEVAHLVTAPTGERRAATAGGAGRGIALSGAIVGGIVLAIALIPQFGAWTTWMADRLASH